MARMKLTKLILHRYRDLEPGTALAFSPTLNLVLGENGTGRTTLLELLSTVLCSDFSGLMRETFSLEYALAFAGMDIHVRVRNTPSPTAMEPEGASQAALARAPRTTGEPTPEFEPFMEVTLQLHGPEARLDVHADASGMRCELDGRPAWKRTMHWSLLDRSVWTVVFLVAQFLAPEVKERLQPLLNRTFLLGPARFDEALGMFDKLGAIRYAMERRGEDIFPLGLMALPPWLTSWLRERVDRGPAATVLELRHDAEERGFLARFVALAGFGSGTLRVEVLENRTFEDGGRVAFGHFSFHFTRQDGSELTQEHLGHGQKRLLAFLYYLDINADFVVADELANGLHPRWVEACLGDIGPRQTFLTSQNPLVFERLTFPSAEALRTSLIHCFTSRREGRERRAWTHPSEEVARGLFEAHREGKLPFGALLRAHGLW